MTTSFSVPPPRGKGQDGPVWPDSLARDCRYHGDLFLGHDTSRIAELAGRSRRDLNRLREWGGLDDDRLTDVETICRALYAAAALGVSFHRRAALVQPIADALAADFAPRLSLVEESDLLRSITTAQREDTEATTRTLELMRDGIRAGDANDLVREHEEAIACHHQLIAKIRSAVRP